MKQKNIFPGGTNRGTDVSRLTKMSEFWWKIVVEIIPIIVMRKDDGLRKIRSALSSSRDSRLSCIHVSCVLARDQGRRSISKQTASLFSFPLSRSDRICFEKEKECKIRSFNPVSVTIIIFLLNYLFPKKRCFRVTFETWFEWKIYICGMCGLSVISLFSIEVKGKVFFFFIGISIRDR